MAFPATKLDMVVEIALGADLTDLPTSWTWTDVTSYVLVDKLVAITRGRTDVHSQATPATCSLLVRNDDGRWCRTNPKGAWYGQLSKNTPLRVRVNGGAGYISRFTGYIDQLPPRWDLSQRYVTVPITASGVMRRVGRSDSIAHSALYDAHTEGYYTGGTTVGYWPLEDGSSSTSFASGIDGPPALYINMTPTADSTIDGSDPLPTAGTNAAVNCQVPAYNPSTTWATRWVMKIPTAVSIPQSLMRWYTGGTLVMWQLVVSPGSPDTIKLEAYDSSGVEQLGMVATTFTDASGTELYGQQVYIECNAAQNGANIDWDFTVWYAAVGSSGIGGIGSEPATIGNVSAIGFGVGWGAVGMDGTILGHIAVSSNSSYGALTGYGATGYASETTFGRFTRLLNAQNIPVHASVNLATAMGPQFTDTLERQLQEVSDTEGMPIYDGRTGSLSLDARQDRYNASPTLTLDFAQSQVAGTPEPTDDDQDLHNDVIVSRHGGSSARATQLTGPNNVTEVGVYPLQLTVNTETDSVLPHHAGWQRHLGTLDELRWPQISMNLHRTTSKITDWLSCDIGSRIQLQNPPGQLAPDAIDVLLEGYEEILGPKTWTVVANCSPATPWDVWELEDSTLGRLDTPGSYLLSTYASGATSLLVAASVGSNTGSPQWSTTGEPYDWSVAGEQITVGTMNTNASAFVAAGVAAHADNATVSPALPAGVQQGDLLLVFAAQRNTSAVLNTPTGYTALMADANVCLFGKIHTGTESAPTVSWTGTTAAGDTMSAQMAAFRYTQNIVAALSGQSNSAAANIGYPAAYPTAARQVVVWLGWKQDDWTSVATVSGATEIAEAATTTGNDQGLVWDYLIQTTAVEQASGSFVVTGGTSVISKGYTVILKGDVQSCTVTRGVNGVTKAQTQGTAIQEWKPGSGGLAL